MIVFIGTTPGKIAIFTLKKQFRHFRGSCGADTCMACELARAAARIVSRRSGAAGSAGSGAVWRPRLATALSAAGLSNGSIPSIGGAGNRASLLVRCAGDGSMLKAA
jgi:hypothetical protein